MEKAIAILAVILASSIASAAAIISVSPQEIWLDESSTFKVAFSCGQNETGISVVFIDPVGGEMACDTPMLMDGKYEAICTITQGIFGQYDVVAECFDGETTTNATLNNALVAYKLFLSTAFSGGNYYTRDLISGVRVNFKLNDRPLGRQDSPSFKMYLVDASGFPVELEMYPPTSYYYSYPDIVLSGRIPEMPAGTYDLKIVGTYRGHSAEVVVPASVVVKPSLSLEIISDPSIKISGPSLVSVVVKATEKGKILKGLKESNFVLKIFDKSYNQISTLQPQEVSFDQTAGTYLLKFSVPELSSSKYSGYLVLNYGGNSVQPDKYLQIDVVVPFKGYFVDSRGNSLTGEIRLSSPSIGVFTIQPSGTGTFESSVLPGNYTMEVVLPGFRAVIDGVVIRSAVENPFRFDIGQRGQEVPGIRTAKLVVFEFALPFSEANVQIQYDDALVYDEQKIEVYACRNWNYGRRECAGTWERIAEPKVDPVRNIVSFNVTHFSAFVVGERKQLFFSVELDKKSYFRGEGISISGKVVDESESPVKDAVVEYEIEGTNITGSSATDVAGYFNILAYAPDREGSFKIVLRAKKEPYVETEVSTIISVYSKAEADVRAPETVVVKLGEKVNFTVDVFNTGQVKLDSLKVSASGLNEKWFDYSPSYIDLEPGEAKKVAVSILIPKEDCEVEQCKNFYFLKVRIANEKAQDEATVTVKVEVPEEKPSPLISANAVKSAGQWIAGLAVVGIFAAFLIFTKKQPKRREEKPKLDRIKMIKTTLKVKEDFKIDERKFRFRRK